MGWVSANGFFPIRMWVSSPPAGSIKALAVVLFGPSNAPAPTANGRGGTPEKFRDIPPKRLTFQNIRNFLNNGEHLCNNPGQKSNFPDNFQIILHPRNPQFALTSRNFIQRIRIKLN